jgi:hypothetical protein
MKTKNQFVQIPKVGSVPAYKVDPQNRAEVSALIRRADAYFALSAKAWIRGNNSGNSKTLAECTREENRQAQNGEALLKPFGIETDWPGLYPSFKVNGFSEYTTEAAVLSAIGQNRNWLKN